MTLPTPLMTPSLSKSRSTPSGAAYCTNSDTFCTHQSIQSMGYCPKVNVP